MDQLTFDPTPDPTAAVAAPARKKMSKGRIAGIAGGGCCALILVFFIIGLIGVGLSGDLGASPEPDPTTVSEAPPEEETTSEEPVPEESTGTEAPAPEETITTEAEPTEEPTTAEPTDEAPNAQEWADGIANEVLTNNGADSWADFCGTGWCSYVTNVHANAEGTLHVDLQVEPGAADNEQLARNTASFIILSAAADHPELDWVVVNDGTGTIIDQYQPSDFGR